GRCAASGSPTGWQRNHACSGRKRSVDGPPFDPPTGILGDAARRSALDGRARVSRHSPGPKGTGQKTRRQFMALFSLSRDPVNALLRLQQEWEQASQTPRGLDLGPSGRGVLPPVNVFRKDQDVVVRIEVPGFAPEDLSIESR